MNEWDTTMQIRRNRIFVRSTNDKNKKVKFSNFPYTNKLWKEFQKAGFKK